MKNDALALTHFIEYSNLEDLEIAKYKIMKHLSVSSEYLKNFNIKKIVSDLDIILQVASNSQPFIEVFKKERKLNPNRMLELLYSCIDEIMRVKNEGDVISNHFVEDFSLSEISKGKNKHRGLLIVKNNDDYLIYKYIYRKENSRACIYKAEYLNDKNNLNEVIDYLSAKYPRTKSIFAFKNEHNFSIQDLIIPALIRKLELLFTESPNSPYCISLN